MYIFTLLTLLWWIGVYYSHMRSPEVYDGVTDSAVQHSHQGSRLTAFCSTIPGVFLLHFIFMPTIGKSVGFFHIQGESYIFQFFSAYFLQFFIVAHLFLDTLVFCDIRMCRRVTCRSLTMQIPRAILTDLLTKSVQSGSSENTIWTVPLGAFEAPYHLFLSIVTMFFCYVLH